MYWLQLITNIFYLGLGGFVMYLLYETFRHGGVEFIQDRDTLLFGLICFMTIALSLTVSLCIAVLVKLWKGED